MLNNLLNTLSFGSIIQQNGKPYTVIMRLTDRLFVGMEQNAQLPAPLMLVQVDLKMGPPDGAPVGGRLKAKVQNQRVDPDTAQTEDAAPTGSDKQEKR